MKSSLYISLLSFFLLYITYGSLPIFLKISIRTLISLSTSIYGHGTYVRFEDTFESRIIHTLLGMTPLWNIYTIHTLLETGFESRMKCGLLGVNALWNIYIVYTLLENRSESRKSCSLLCTSIF